MNLLARALLLGVVAACGSSPPAQTPGPSRPEPPPTTPPAGAELAQLGQPCGEAGQRCDAPAKCVSYFGIAGPRGPEFKSCEITCAGVNDPEPTIAPAVYRPGCPAGTRCVTIADGPGAVCRSD